MSLSVVGKTNIFCEDVVYSETCLFWPPTLFPPPVLLNTVYKSCVIRPLCWCWKLEKRKPNCAKNV